MNPKIISLLESNQFPNWQLAAAIVGVDEAAVYLGRLIYELSISTLSQKDPFENNFFSFTQNGIHLTLGVRYDFSVHLVFCGWKRIVMKNETRPTVNQVVEYFCSELKKLLS